MKTTFFSDLTPYIWVDKYQRVTEVAFQIISGIRSLLGVIPSKNYNVKFEVLLMATMKIVLLLYVVGSKSFRSDIQKPRQMENAVRDI